MKYAVLVLLLLLAACGANTAVTATPTAMIATKSSALQPTSPTATLASPQATPTTGTSTNLPIATVAQPTVTPMPVPTSTPIAIPLVAPTSVPATSTPTVLIPPQSPTIAANPTTTYIASFPFRVEVQKTWTEQQAGKGAVYYIQVVVCNQTQQPQGVYASALKVTIKPRDHLDYAGSGTTPRETPDGGFVGTLTIQPAQCGGGVVTINPRTTEIPTNIWYNGAGRPGTSATTPLQFPFP